MTVQINGSTGITTPAIDLTTPLPEIDGGTGSTGAYKMGMGTAVASTSGTSIDFTGIPSWAKRITVALAGVSSSGSSFLQAQMGAGSVETTGYVSSSGASASTTGVLIIAAIVSADTFHGQIVFVNMGSNMWSVASNIVRYAASTQTGSGYKTLAGTLDRLRITTVNGTDTFDAGSINIMYEGV